MSASEVCAHERARMEREARQAQPAELRFAIFRLCSVYVSKISVHSLCYFSPVDLFVLRADPSV